jgi:MFS transporter, ACS family, hexuronate transporter
MGRFRYVELRAKSGLAAAGSGLGGMLSTRLVGLLVTNYSYTPVFLAMGFLHPLAYLLVRQLRHRRENAPAPAA